MVFARVYSAGGMRIFLFLGMSVFEHLEALGTIPTTPLQGSFQ